MFYFENKSITFEMLLLISCFQYINILLQNKIPEERMPEMKLFDRMN